MGESNRDAAAAQTAGLPLELFDHVYTAKYRHVYSTCYAILLRHTEALNACELTWRRALPELAKHEAAGLDRLLNKCAVDVCIQLLRQQTDADTPDLLHDPDLLDNVQWDTTEIKDLAHRVHSDVAVRKALQPLSPKQRVAIVLKYRFGYSNADIGMLLGCSTGTAVTFCRSALLAASQKFNEGGNL